MTTQFPICYILNQQKYDNNVLTHNVYYLDENGADKATFDYKEATRFEKIGDAMKKSGELLLKFNITMQVIPIYNENQLK